MAAQPEDYFQEVGTPGSATYMTAPGYTIGATTMNVQSTAGFPADTGVIFAVDTTTTVNGVETQAPGSYCIFEGKVASATSLSGVSLLYGTPQNYPAGATTRVYITVSSQWVKRLVEGLSVSLNQTGTLKNSVVSTPNIADDAVTAPKLVGIDKSNLTTDSNPYKFSCKNSVDQTGVAQNTWTTLALGTELFDTNNNFASNIYTVPVSGFYFFSASTWCLATAAGNMIGLAIRFVKNGSVELRRIYNYDNNVTYDVMSQDITGLFELAEGDTVSFMGNGVTVSGTVYFNNVYFNGFLVSKT